MVNMTICCQIQRVATVARKAPIYARRQFRLATSVIPVRCTFNVHNMARDDTHDEGLIPRFPPQSPASVSSAAKSGSKKKGSKGVWK